MRVTWKRSRSRPRRRQGNGSRRWLLLRNGLVFLLFVAALVLLFPPVARTPEYDYSLGQVTGSGEEVIAPIDFRVPVEPRLLQERRAHASLEVLPVYRRDEDMGRQIRGRLAQLQEELRHLSRPDSVILREGLDSLPDDWRVDRLMRHHAGLDSTVLARLLKRSDREAFIQRVAALCDSLEEAGILDSRSPLTLQRGDETPLVVLDAEGEREMDASTLLDQDQLDGFLQRRAWGWPEWDAQSRDSFVRLARAQLRPNLRYQAEETSRRKGLAADAVPAEVLVPRGVRILGPNMQVTQEHLAKLQALESQSGVQRGSRLQAVLLTLGRVLLLLFLGLLALRFLLLYMPDFFERTRRLLFLMLLLLAFLAASKYLLGLEGGAWLLPVTFVAMLVASLYDSVLAMMSAVMALLLLALSTPVPPEALLVGFLAAGAAVFSLGRIRSRLQLYKSILFISLAYLLGIGAVQLGHKAPLAMLADIGRGVAGGVVCAWLVLPITPLLERFFDVTTDFTLLELTDLNRPILKRMKVEAPGTFQHSLAVSNLAEAAAEAIGANSLLAKVCAYYHDIGKLGKPEYFRENQGMGKNKHDKLNPNMSALIIAAHVKEGLELAEKIKLPSIVARGIPEHHGRTLMSYFYRKAQEQAGDGEVSDEKFRYPGPRPQSPETAILMLADTVEATVRSLDEPTPTRIRTVVTEAIERRLKERELEECGLSIQDLARIRESFITTFLSIHHPRIKYPSGKEERPAEEGGARDEVESLRQPGIS